MIRKMYCIETEKNSLYVDKDVYDYIVSLEQQIKKQKKVIDNAIEYVEHRIVKDDYMLCVDTDMVQKELLYILNEVSK